MSLIITVSGVEQDKNFDEIIEVCKRGSEDGNCDFYYDTINSNKVLIITNYHTLGSITPGSYYIVDKLQYSINSDWYPVNDDNFRKIYYIILNSFKIY